MKSILVISYSQSGEVERVARMFAEQLQSPGVEIAFAALQPIADYPYPWRSIRRFFDTMPECVLRQPSPIQPLPIDPRTRYDLIVLAYPVWFLTPAPVVQGFFNTPQAALLRDTEVITICVCRAMWQQASQWMKQLLATAGAIHCDNIVAVHQGSPLLTLISTPRALLSGKRDAFLKLFPQAGVAAADFSRMRLLGLVAAGQLNTHRSQGAPLLAGQPAVVVKRWFILPEVLGWYCFRAWAKIVQQAGRWHPILRSGAIYIFAVFLVAIILVGLPLVTLGTALAMPLIRRRLNDYSRRLAGPTGEPGSR